MAEEEEEYGHPDWKCCSIKKTASLWKQGMGGTSCRYGLPFEMHGLRPSGYDTEKAVRKKCPSDYIKDRKGSVRKQEGQRK